MLRISSARFLEGPNLYADFSGLALDLVGTGSVARLTAWRPSPERSRQICATLAVAMPALADSPLALVPSRLARSDCPLLDLFLCTAAAAISDFCVHVQPATIQSLNKTSARAFLPAEDAPVAEAAVALALKVLTLLATPAGRAAPGLASALLQAYLGMRTTVRVHGLNQSVIALARSASARGIPVERLPFGSQFVQLGHGCHRVRLFETSADTTSMVATLIAKDKLGTIRLLASHGLPTPGTRPVTSASQARKIADSLGYPLVVKPRSLSKGRGVTTGITDPVALETAVTSCLALGAGVLIERYVPGMDHRLLVVGGRLVAAAIRRPATVTGDGRRNVGELIEETNRDPQRGLLPFERLLERIQVDAALKNKLAAGGLGLDSVPAAGQQVVLRSTANLSTGGTAEDVTDRVHPDNRAMAERAARLLGLEVTGIDFLSEDIARSWRETTSAVIEVNATPGLRPHLSANAERDVSGAIVERLFPKGHDGRIPTIGVTGSIGKTTTCRMIAAIMAAAGYRVGLSGTQGAWVGAEQIQQGDVASGAMARRLLQDPAVELGVFELARGGLIRRGMVLDGVDVGVVLNVHDNHLGLDGVQTREDLARVKSLLARHARKLVVLNADDPLCLAMRDTVQAAEVCLIGPSGDNDTLRRHRDSGGLVGLLECVEGSSGEASRLRLLRGYQTLGTLAAAEVASSHAGQFQPALVNALFACAATLGLGLDFETIRRGLVGFESTWEQNPGRMNFIDGLGFRCLLTWSDGPVAMTELARFASVQAVSGQKRLLLFVMGNRSDEFILATARQAAGCFDSYGCFDWHDLRGRSAGAVPHLLAQGLEQAGVSRAAITQFRTQAQAIAWGMEASTPEDLLVVLSYDPAVAIQLIKSHCQQVRLQD